MGSARAGLTTLATTQVISVFQYFQYLTVCVHVCVYTMCWDIHVAVHGIAGTSRFNGAPH